MFQVRRMEKGTKQKKREESEQTNTLYYITYTQHTLSLTHTHTHTHVNNGYMHVMFYIHTLDLQKLSEQLNLIENRRARNLGEK